MPDLGPKAPDVAVAIVELINDHAGFDVQFEAALNSFPFYKLEQLKDVKVDVFPSQIRRPIQQKTPRNKEFSIDVLIQQRAETQDIHNALTNLADDILYFVLTDEESQPGRKIPRTIFVDDKALSVIDGSLSNDQTHDQQAKFEDNRFESVMRFTLLWRP